MSITYGSVCSGIEAPTAAWHPLGWKPLWFSEIEPFPKAVLAHHYPTVTDLGDMTTIPARILGGEVIAPDVFVGGTPCQSFSVAGLRRGLADPRGKLTRTYVEILDAIDTVRLAAGKPPAVALWENVPGVLSDRDNAFGNFLGAMCGEDDALLPAGPRWTNAGCVLGPRRSLAWRVLDAQYFGVPQRRRRVFLVASSRAHGVDPSEVLFIEPGMPRDPPSRRGAREEAAADARPSVAGDGVSRGKVTVYTGDGIVADPISANEASTYTHEGNSFRLHNCVQEHPEVPEVCGTLSDGAHNGGGLNAYTDRVLPVCVTGDRTHALKAEGADASEDGTGRGTPIVSAGMSVRRLTPRECERLQGFPDDYTRIVWRGKTADDCPDGPRYKALGNSMAVPVIRWIGMKIERASLA